MKYLRRVIIEMKRYSYRIISTKPDKTRTIISNIGWLKALATVSRLRKERPDELHRIFQSYPDNYECKGF